VHLALKRHTYTPHLWSAVFAVLALTAVSLVGLFTAHRQSTEASSALEPTFSLPGGYYDRDIQLDISTPYPDADVLFTVDGSVPTLRAGTIYTQPIRLSTAMPGVTVIRARTVLPDHELGPVVSASYLIGIPAALPMLSLIIEPEDLWSQERGIVANATQRGGAWERPVDITYVEQDRRSGFHIQAGARIHGGISRLDAKKSLRLYFRQEYGANRLEYPLFADSDVRAFKRLILHGGGQDWLMSSYNNWTLMRNMLVDSLALELGGYAAHSRPALVFVNGELWGIYRVCERIDRYFLADHYGIESADFLESPTEYPVVHMGNRENWEHLLRFAETHDLADPANYAYVQSQVDLANFADYNILQIYIANTDWPNKNVYQFRPHVQGGRWHWVFWDTDHGFGAYPMLSYGGPDVDFVGSSKREMALLRELLESPLFLDHFLSRAAHLLNTTLAPQSVIARIDAMESGLEPDIAYESIRWSSSTSWKSNVMELRDFARRRPDYVRQHIVEKFDLEGTAQLVFSPPASGSGYIASEGDLVPNLPWQGIYFRGVPIQITAVPAPGYRFAGWDPPDLPQTPVITLTVRAAQTITPRFETVGKDAVRPGHVVLTRYQASQDGTIGGNWFELLVTRPGGIDLRGWRITDNDTKTATDEGSLIFGDNPALAHVPQGTRLRVILDPWRPLVPQEPRPPSLLTDEARGRPPQDDLAAWDRQMVLYAGNGNLDVDTDPGFSVGSDDTLVLLAPGATERFSDDQGIAFAIVREGALVEQVSGQALAVTPASFGVLVDGVVIRGAEPRNPHY
jgi:hypothetical protein